MVPCLRLYAFLACQLTKGYPFADHEYTGALRAVGTKKMTCVCCGVLDLQLLGRQQPSFLPLPCRVGAQLLKCQTKAPAAASLASLLVASLAGCCSGPAEWVRSYSSAEYLWLPAKAEALLDETGGAEDFGECSLAC